MTRFNPDIHHRRSIRLKDYDYSTAGAYFVTICTWDRGCCFEEYPQLKEIVENQWRMLPERFEGIMLDEYVIMPNHMHGIIVIIADRAPARGAPTDSLSSNSVGAGLAPALLKHATIGDIVGSFKSITSNEWLKVVKSGNINMRGKFWQRNYYEHVIRSDEELNSIRQYITENPLKWELDEENPVNIKTGGYTNGNDSGNQRGQALHRDRPSKADAVGIR